MKSALLLAILFLAPVPLLKSQVLVGAEAGGNFSSYNGSPLSNGYQFGLAIKNRKHKYFNMGAEFNYRTKGGNFDFVDGSPGSVRSVNGYYDVSFFGIQVLPEMNWGDTCRFGWFFQTGFYLSVPVLSYFTGDIQTSGRMSVSSVQYSRSTNPDSRTLVQDIGIATGTGFCYRLNSTISLSLCGRILFETNNAIVSTMDTYKSIDYGLMAGLTYRLP